MGNGMGESLEKKASSIRHHAVSHEPIILPQNPYWAALKEFGLDEMIAGVIDAGATTVASAVVPPAMKMAVLPFVGPVLEKVGFFPQHFYKAYGVYKTTPPSSRKNLSHYVKDALRNGGANLAKDILIHDPIYIGLMFGGLQALPNVPPGFLSASSYILGVLAVAGIDVTKDELLHRRGKNKLKAAGFEEERYYESRFYCNGNGEVLAGISKEFGLIETRKVRYEDRYFKNTFSAYSGRTVKVRLRHRQATPKEQHDLELPGEWMDSLQVVFTRAREHREGLDQCRYFPSYKEKLWLTVPQMPAAIAGVKNEKARKLVLASTTPESYDVNFRRTMHTNDELAVCSDDVADANGLRVVEIKVWKDKQLMRQAMRYLMLECPVVQTTHGKSDLVR